MKNTIKIYITDLKEYNNDKLIGERVNLNEVTEDELNEVLAKYNEETFISDFESSFKIEEYTNPLELWNFAQELELLDEQDLLKVEIQVNYGLNNFEYALSNYDNVDLFMWSAEEKAKDAVDDWLFGEISDSIIHYIDYKAIASDIEIDWTSDRDDDGNDYLFYIN